MDPVRILWVKANKLLPVHSGGDIRSYHIARYLAARHELTFFSILHDGVQDAEYERLLAEHLPGSVCLSTGRQASKPARALDYLRCLPSGDPYAVSRFQSERVQKKLRSWFEREAI